MNMFKYTPSSRQMKALFSAGLLVSLAACSNGPQTKLSKDNRINRADIAVHQPSEVINSLSVCMKATKQTSKYRVQIAAHYDATGSLAVAAGVGGTTPLAQPGAEVSISTALGQAGMQRGLIADKYKAPLRLRTVTSAGDAEQGSDMSVRVSGGGPAMRTGIRTVLTTALLVRTADGRIVADAEVTSTGKYLEIGGDISRVLSGLGDSFLVTGGARFYRQSHMQISTIEAAKLASLLAAMNGSAILSNACAPVLKRLGPSEAVAVKTSAKKTKV